MRSAFVTGRAGLFALLLASCGRDPPQTPAVWTGDLTGDSVPDVVVGSPWSDGDARRAGRVSATDGRDGRSLWTIAGQRPREWFGAGIVGGADLDGDGRTDLLVTSERGSAAAR